MRRTLLLALGVCLLAGSSGCHEQPGALADLEPHGVILISVDTLRADHLGVYGYPRPTSPAIDAIAREGVVFEDASSVATWTLPAHASLLSGVYPVKHGMRRENSRPWRFPQLAGLLSHQGYWTGAVVNSAFLSDLFGMQRGFRGFRYVIEAWNQVGPSSLVTAQVEEWLRAREGVPEPFFLFVHYFDVHSDYLARPSYLRRFVRPSEARADGTTLQLLEVEKGRLRFDARDVAHLVDRYDAGLRQTDDELGRLFAFLRAEGWMERVLLVLTSDHGEEFLDHGGVLHGRAQYQELLRVPLLMRGPGLPAGRRVTTPVSLVDVAPTVLRQLELPVPPYFDGIDLAPLWQSDGRAAPPRVLFSDSMHGLEDTKLTYAIRAGRYKLHYDDGAQEHRLFDLGSDPGERHDLALERREEAANLLAALRRYRALAPDEGETQELPPELVEQLEALGYLQ